jgi:hypothetical protein
MVYRRESSRNGSERRTAKLLEQGGIASGEGRFKFDGDAFKKKAMKAAQDAVTKRLQSVRCPVHGQTARVTPKTVGSNFEWDIHGCCDELVAKVKAALKN